MRTAFDFGDNTCHITGSSVHIYPYLFSSKMILSFMNVFDVDDNNHITGLITKIRNLYREFLSLDVAERGAGTSFFDFIKYSIRSKASTDGLTLSMRAATFAAKALNLALSMAVGALIGMAINGVVSAIADYAQRIDTAATKTKEEADAAKNATSSLKDLVDAYEELGDKSGWSTEDFDQAKDIQEELLALAKEQGTLDENKANQLDLQNGKYEEQLGLLKDITEEQLKASESKLIQSKDAQSNKLVKTAKDNNRSHFFSSVSANTNRGIMNELKDAGIDVFNKNGSFGAKDLNDPDSIAKYYSELGRALDYIVQNTTEAQRAAGGAYNTVYKYLMDEQSALRDDVDSYNDSTDAVNENVNARRKLQAIDFWSDGKSNGMDVSYSFDKVNSAIETLKNTIDGFDASKLNELLWGTNEGLSDEQAQALTNLRKALTDMDFSADTNGVNAFIQALVQVGIVAQSSANGVDALAAGAQKMEDISSKMDEIQSAYKASTSAMEEYNQYGYMSLDSLQSLLTMNTEYLNCLELVNGRLQINKQSYAELLAAEYAEAAATILSNAQHEVANLTADDTAESTDDLKEKTEAEKTALENLLPALKNATAATATYSAAQEFANEVEKAGERGVDPAKLEEITNRTNTQLSLLYTNMNAALKGGQALTNQLNGFGSSSKNAGKSSSTTSKSVADLSSAFDTLTKAMKEYNQYGYISADTMKSLIGVDDKFTACLTEQNGKLELNTAKFRTFVRAQLEEANAANDGGKSAGEMKKILDWLNSSVDSETISFEQLTDAIKGYGTAMDEAKEKTDAIKSAFSGLYDVQQKTKNSQFGVGDLDATESKIESILQLSKFFGDNKDLMDNLVDKNGNINLNTEAFKKATLDELDKRIKAANETGGAAATALANSLSSDKANIESGKISVSDYLVGLGTDLERVNTELDKYQTNWSTLKDAMDEWNTTGQLTQDTMQKLQELPEEFSNLLTYDEDGNAKIDVKALRQSYVDKLSAFAKEFEGSPIGIQVQAMIDDVREPTPEEYKALAEKTVKYQKALAQYTKKMSAIDSNKDLSEDEALKQKAEVQKELDDALEKALLEVQETDAQVTTKLKKHWDGVEKGIEEFKSALSDAKAVLSSFLSLLSTLNDKSNNDLKIWGDAMGKVIDKRIEALNKQKEALEENNEATERAIELSKAQDALARAQQQRTTRVYTENGYEWQANAEDVRTAREDLADKQREWNNKDAEKAIDDQIKKYNEFKDKLSEVMDDIGKSWKDYQKELEYTAQIQKMTITQMEGSLDGYHNKIIASLNTGSAITSIQNLIANLESLINTLTKVNNLYSMLKTGEYKDLGTKGLWNTIKGFFNKGKSENVNKSFKDTFNAAKKAFNAGKKQLTDTATTGATDVINAMINQIKTSGNGLIETFGGIWDKIKVGAQSLFRGSGSGGGIISTFVNGFKAIGNAVSKSKIGSTILGGIGKVGTTLLSGGGKLLAGAGKLIGTAGSALAAAGPYAIPIAAAAGLGIYGAAKNFKHQKEIWSNKEDGFGKKAIKSVATFFWDISPIGAIVNLCKDISGKSKKTAENTKDTADSSSETAENTKHSATNLTINATQIVSKEENKATDETDKKNDATANEDKTVKTAATTLTGAGLGAAAGMAIGGPAGALIGTLLGGFAGFFFGRHANGLKSSKTNHFANVDERGSELIVRKPASGRYTYLETGDGVVPADITSRLFEMGGNPDKWFSDQLAKHGSASMVQSRSSGGISLSIGDVNVNNPVGDSDALARELVNRLPNKVVQELNRR
nr:MAG TPA: bacteriocin [Bacteriophage sp.]